GKDGKFRVSLYKALLFLHVQNGIKSGALNLEYSYKYRPLDDYLIDRARWQRDKQQLIERAGLEGFVDPRKTLKELDEPFTSNVSSPTATLWRGRTPTPSSRRTAASLSQRPSRKRATPSLYSNTSPTAASCRWWKALPPSTASRTT